MLNTKGYQSILRNRIKTEHIITMDVYEHEPVKINPMNLKIYIPKLVPGINMQTQQKKNRDVRG